MKKLFLYVTAFSLLFFSCKSTNSLAKDLKSTSENLENVSKNLESTSKNLESTSKNLGADSENGKVAAGTEKSPAGDASAAGKSSASKNAGTNTADASTGNLENIADSKNAGNVDSTNTSTNKEIVENALVDDLDNLNNEESGEKVQTASTNNQKNNTSTKFRPYAVFDEYFKGENEKPSKNNLNTNTEDDWKDDVILSPFAIVDEISSENAENDAEIGEATEIALADDNANADESVTAQINPQDETENISSEIVLDQDDSDTDGERIIVKDGNAVISELLPFENGADENIAETAELETQPAANETQKLEQPQTELAQQTQPIVTENRAEIAEANQATATVTQATQPQPVANATQSTTQPQTAETNTQSAANVTQPAQVPTSQIVTQPTQPQSNANVINTTPIPTAPTVAQQPTRQAQTATTQTAPQVAQNTTTTSPAANRIQESATRQSSQSYEQIITDGEQENSGEEEIDGNTGTKPSRSVTVDLGAYLDVEYPGNGWIYIGEEDNTENMLFFGRKLGGNTTSFTLRSRKSGTTVLHFYKNDLLTGKYIDDYLEVIVTNKPVENSSAHTVAPAYAMVVPPRPSRARDNATAQTATTQETTAAVPETRETAKANEQRNTTETEKPANTTARTAIQTPSQTPQQPQEQNRSQLAATQTQPSVIEQNEQQAADIQTTGKDAVQLLADAKRLYDDKKFNDALQMLHSFFDIAESHIDEGLFLQGQILESNSEVRNIKEAIDSYGILINNWPDSRLWQEAQKRYIYLRRFYINIH